MYDGYRIIPISWAYGMKNVKKKRSKKKKMGKSSEILILNN